MIAEIGHFAMVLALAVGILQSALPLWGVRRNDHTLMRLAPTLAGVMFVAMGIAFACLLSVHALSDFSTQNVFHNSHSTMPLVFRLSAAWGNHEGSMVLWTFTLALFAALLSAFSSRLPVDLKAATLAVQGLIATTFLLFILLTSNPFLRLDPAPAEGRELNPVLQDIGLALHPPLLYIGYVGFSLAYSFAVAALVTGRIDAGWARAVRPWVLIAWIFLTLGIALGSYWAYYELGWGGWWFWDPVENASLMPWLAGTALFHSIIVMEKRNAMRVWTLLLAILAFSLSLMGTFLVRSGILTSVHAFAVDPARGIVILVILSLFIGGALALYAWRAGELGPGGLFSPLSREAALLLNNLLLATAAATVFVGTLYPLALEAFSDDKISVGPPYFNLTFGVLMVPLMLCMPFGPMLAWKRGDLLAAAERLLAAAGLALVAAAISAWLTQGGPLLALAGFALGTFVIAGAVSDIILRARLLTSSPRTALSRLAGLPRQAFGTLLGHAGIGVFLIGVVSASTFESETIRTLRVGETMSVGGYELRLVASGPRSGANYQDVVAGFDVRRDGISLGHVESAKRVYLASRVPTTETGQMRIGFGQLYVALGEVGKDGKVGVRAYWKPNILLIWFGLVMAAAGGLCSLSDRRLRIGAPAAARRAIAPAVTAQ